MTNTPCRNPKLCGVKTHRPGTQAACERQGSGARGSAASSIAGAPVKLTTPDAGDGSVGKLSMDDFTTLLDRSNVDYHSTEGEAGTVINFRFTGKDGQELDGELEYDNQGELQWEPTGPDQKDFTDWFDKLSEPHISEKIQAILDRPEGYRTETEKPLSSEEALDLLRAKLSGEPKSTDRWWDTASESERTAYDRMMDEGYGDYPHLLKDEPFLDKIAESKGLNPESVRSAAATMIADGEREQAEIRERHNKRASEIVAKTPEKVKRGMLVVVNDGTPEGRIVKLTSVRGDKFYGETQDAWEDTYWDGFDTKDIRRP